MSTCKLVVPSDAKNKRKIEEKHVSSFLKKQNKKGKLTTYSFVKSNLSIVTPHETLKDATLTQMAEVVFKEPPSSPTKKKIIKKGRFVAGSIVMINGHNFDHCKFSGVVSALTLYGVVHKDQSELGQNETNVEFVACGEYEWLDKNIPHTLTATYPDANLKKYTGLPRTLAPSEPYSEEDPIRWFVATEDGWVMKKNEAPCYQCGDPWCMLNHARPFLINMVKAVKMEATGMKAQKELRFKCYRKAIHEKYGYLGVKERKRMGYCFERLARDAFPEEDVKYAGRVKLDGENSMHDYHNFNV